jgi:hypothetical protein
VLSKFLMGSHLQEGRHGGAYTDNNAVIAIDQRSDIHQHRVENDLWIGLDGVDNGNGGRFSVIHGSDMESNILDGSPGLTLFFEFASHVCGVGAEVGVVDGGG